MLETLIYVSAAAPDFDEAGIDGLLADARRRNARNGITGVLLYAEGGFLQVLEGPPEALDETMARIRKDDRHKGIIEVFRCPIDERGFPQWSMGWRKGTAKGAFPLTADSLKSAVGPKARAEVLALLRRFYTAAYRYDAA